MKTNRTLARGFAFLALLSLNYPFVNASAQSGQHWTINELPAGLIAWWQAENNLLDTVVNHLGA